MWYHLIIVVISCTRPTMACLMLVLEAKNCWLKMIKGQTSLKRDPFIRFWCQTCRAAIYYIISICIWVSILSNLNYFIFSFNPNFHMCILLKYRKCKGILCLDVIASSQPGYALWYRDMYYASHYHHMRTDCDACALCMSYLKL